MSEEPAAGVDLGGTKIYSLVATPSGEVLGEDRRPTEAPQGRDAVIDRMAGSIRSSLEQAGLATDGIQGVGISAPGPCDPERGVVTRAPNLLGWEEVHVTQAISDRLGAPSLLEHDAAAACYGEFRFGAAQGFRHIVYVTLSTGIGGGIMVDGRVYHGASGAAGEVGHLIVDEDGPLCNCGNRGCVEALGSGLAIAREAAAALEAGRSPHLAEAIRGRVPTAQLVHEAALRADPVSRQIIERAGHYAGLGLAAVLNFFNPEALILGGGLLNMGDLYLGPALRAAREGTFDQVLSDVTIAQAKLGDRSGALGAAALVMDRRPG